MNKFYIWKEHKILDGIHILFAKIGVKLKVLCAIEKTGANLPKFESGRDLGVRSGA